MKGSWGTLVRWRLSLCNGVGAVAGYLACSEAVRYQALALVCCGVALLAAGASAANQVLERDYDRLMARTSHRPLPRGELTVGSAAVVACGATAAGLLLLFGAGGSLCVLLGGGALLVYLYCYTPLKRRTPFALLPGALCGAVPPLIGWSAAGGDPSDYRIVLLCGVFYLWQIPHFWLLLRRHREEYRQAGFALAPPCAGAAAPLSIGVVWSAALVVSVLMLPLFGVIPLHPTPRSVPLCAAAAAVVFFPRRAPRYPCLNFFPLLAALVLLASR